MQKQILTLQMDLTL